MLELIAMVAGLAVCVWLPIEMGKIRKVLGHNKFARYAEVLANYRKQIRMLMWLGLVFGVAGVGLALVEDRPGGSIIKLVGAADLARRLRHRLHLRSRTGTDFPSTEPATGSGA